MPSMTTSILMTFMLLAGALLGSGCGNSNVSATFDPEKAHHPSDWLPARHMFAAGDNLDSCRNCHGQDLISGGIAKISCNSCHIGGPTAVHPATFNGLPWLQGGHGQHVAAKGIARCANIWCHGANLEGAALSGPSCRECHDFP